jgi:hypothetical protein
MTEALAMVSHDKHADKKILLGHSFRREGQG